MEQSKSSSDTGAVFVKCLGCGKLVRLPADYDPNVIVRCPRCEETYPIGMLFESEIPELEIVTPTTSEPSSVPLENVGESIHDTEDPSIKTDAQNRFIVAPALSKGAKHKKRRRSRNRTEPRSSSSGRNVSSDSKTTSRSSKRSSSRSKRSNSKAASESSRGWEFAKILLGALMAPPVAQLVIWWGLQMDPLNLGPKVASVIPQVVPAKFQPADDENESESNEAENQDDETKKDERRIKFLPKPPSNIENRGTNTN